MTTFTCEPPTRLDLMASFTGPELGALIDSGCMIAAHAEFTSELRRQLQSLPATIAESASYAHWCGGAYLITKVAPLEPIMAYHVQDEEVLRLIRRRLGESLSFSVQGQSLRLIAGGALSGVAEGALPQALEALEFHEGMELCLERVPRPSCGDDHVTAVNLTRPISALSSSSADQVEQAMLSLAYPAAGHVELTHFRGGPCDDAEVSCCVIPGGVGKGWTVTDGPAALKEAIELAHARAVVRSEAQGDVRGGQTVRLEGLVGRSDLNGAVGVALKFLPSSGRWVIRLADGEGKQLKPANLIPMSCEHGRVFVFWGDAQWSRTQLLGEIARGHWGLCRASVAEIAAAPAERRHGLEGRLVFSPDTES